MMFSMKLNFYLIFFAISFTFACHPEQQSSGPDKPKYIRELIHRTGFVALPYSHDLMSDKETYKYSIDENTIDTLFFNDRNSHIIGFLPDTTVYYGILYFGVGDDFYPCIMTIDKFGNKIDDKSICIGQCAGIMEEYSACIDKVTIEEDLSLQMYYHLDGYIDIQLSADTICEETTWSGNIEKTGKVCITESGSHTCE